MLGKRVFASGKLLESEDLRARSFIGGEAASKIFSA